MTGRKVFVILVAAAAAGICAWLLHAPSLVLDLADRPVDPLEVVGAKAIVLIFVRTDCPTSNRYAPEVARLFEKYSPREVAFWLVYVDRDETPDMIRRHLSEYGYQLDAVRDMQHALVDMIGAKVTPEAAVFVPGEKMVYRGRIDNRYTDFGKGRAAPTRRDLEETLDAVLANQAVPRAKTRAVGCYIADLR